MHMEEPLNLVRLTELLHLERRSRAIVPRKASLHAEVTAAIANGDISPEDAERALSTVREVLFLRSRKVLLLAADIHSGGQPEAKGLTSDERDILSRAVNLLREADPFKGSSGAPTVEAPPPPAPVPVPAGETHSGAGVAPTAHELEPRRGAAAGNVGGKAAPGPAPEAPHPAAPAAPAAPSTDGRDPAAVAKRAAPCSGHVIVRALDDIDFVSLERTYLVRRDDVFSVDPGTAQLLVRSGKVAAVGQGDAV